ncbi:hypothetical protein [Maribacter flavus]|uniref:Uncharacterized protein n=1 Tax=Maribacter flavus TaxID=1658664 RepID=A0A5B2TXI1_9FLAO|nr:hypothetical protein [Maribacter flavus]KAA2218535.1 hypothetical protein F0361_02625 [Maribacter flavus]
MDIKELKKELRNDIGTLRGKVSRLVIDGKARTFDSLRGLGNAILEIEERADKCFYFPNEGSTVVIITKRAFADYINDKF